METISRFPLSSREEFQEKNKNMDLSFGPMTLIIACVMGSLGAYLAPRRQKNLYLWFAIGFFFGALGVFAIFFAPSKKKKTTETVFVPAPTIQGPSDKFWYYLDSLHQQVGPMSLDALTTEWRQGNILTTTYVWHEELPDWKPLQELIR